MQRKVHQGDIDFEIPLQFFNTHGTEVTPRSDVVAEDFQDNQLSHHGSPFRGEE